MEEILETRRHKSVEHKWKWKVWVSLYLSPIFFFHTLYFREVWKRRFHQPSRTYLCCLQRHCGSQQLRGHPLQGIWTEGRFFILHWYLLYTVYYGHIIMFCTIPNDLSRDTVLYHRRHKGHPFFMWSKAQKHHSKRIMKHPFMKSM